MKTWLIFLLISTASCFKLDQQLEKSSTESVKTIIKIIEKWNLKSEKSNDRDITILDLEDHKDFVNILSNKITDENPLLILDPKSCKDATKTQKSAFVIIVTEKLEVVSEKLKIV